MTLTTADIVGQLTAALPEVAAIYLFGSADTPDARADSDVDIAFLSRQPVDASRRWEFAQRLAARLGREVDLVDLGEASTVMRAQVVAHGRRLYCNDDAACARAKRRSTWPGLAAGQSGCFFAVGTGRIAAFRFGGAHASHGGVPQCRGA